MISVGSEVQILPGPPMRALPPLCEGGGRWCLRPGDGGSDDPALLDGGCSRVGGVAQLGEHLLCKQGVIGSIPIVSTTDVCFANVDPTNVLSRRQLFAKQMMRAGPGGWVEHDQKHWMYRGMSRIRFDHVAQAKRPGLCGRADEAAAQAVVIVLWKVNQVLVRLWARAIGISPAVSNRLGLVEIPSFGRLV